MTPKLNLRFLSSLLLASILVLNGLSSCKKGRANFILAGTITDGSLSTTLANSTVSLWKLPVGSSSMELVETQNSSDGTYRFEFERDKSESYTITISKAGYFETIETIPFSTLSIKSENIHDFTVMAKSWARLHFVNVDPQQGDQLKYIKVKGKVGCEDCCPADYITLTEVADTSIYCINDGNSIYSYNYWVLGTSISGSESVVTTPFDTVDIYLEW